VTFLHSDLYHDDTSVATFLCYHTTEYRKELRWGSISNVDPFCNINNDKPFCLKCLLMLCLWLPLCLNTDSITVHWQVIMQCSKKLHFIQWYYPCGIVARETRRVFFANTTPKHDIGYGWGVYHHSQQYLSYIVAVSFIAILMEETGLPRENHRPTNFITSNIIQSDRQINTASISVLMFALQNVLIYSIFYAIVWRFTSTPEHFRFSNLKNTLHEAQR
jgi:hypothetical protein